MHSQQHILAWIVDCTYIASNSATVSGWLSFHPGRRGIGIAGLYSR